MGSETPKLPVQPLFELRALLLAHHDMLVITSEEANNEFAAEKEADLADTIHMSNVLAVQAEKDFRVELLLQFVHRL